jgi:hypothetical protein
MGTRAQFFVGDPRDVNGREWLGCVAWDGYPDGDCGEALKTAATEAEFRAGIASLAAKRDDFCDPATRSFPFPWRNDVFLTDCTYAWFDGAVRYTSFHRGFVSLAAYLGFSDDEAEAYHSQPEQLTRDVAAPITGGPPGPDSIMILTAR